MGKITSSCPNLYVKAKESVSLGTLTLSQNLKWTHLLYLNLDSSSEMDSLDSNPESVSHLQTVETG